MLNHTYFPSLPRSSRLFPLPPQECDVALYGASQCRKALDIARENEQKEQEAVRAPRSRVN